MSPHRGGWADIVIDVSYETVFMTISVKSQLGDAGSGIAFCNVSHLSLSLPNAPVHAPAQPVAWNRLLGKSSYFYIPYQQIRLLQFPQIVFRGLGGLGYPDEQNTRCIKKAEFPLCDLESLDAPQYALP